MNKNEHGSTYTFISFGFERNRMLFTPNSFQTPKLFSRHIKPLDGLRGLSILLVLFAHLWNSKGAPKWLFQLGDQVKVGLLGVEIFFFISGFLITGLLLKEFVENGFVDFKAFYWRRFVRIFPVFYFFLLVTFVLSKTVCSSIPNRYFIPPLFYFSNFQTAFGGNWELGHSWSLSVEEQFYLIWPVTLLWMTRLRRIWVFAAALMLYHTVAKVFAYRLHMPNFMLSPFTQYLPFLFGGSLLSFFLFRNESACKRIFRENRVWIVPLIFGLLLCLEYFPGHGKMGPLFLPLGSLLSAAAVCLLFGFILLPERSFWARFFSNRILRFIGIVSYSWYIWQQLFTSKSFFGDLPVLNTFPYSFIFSFLAAVISYYTVERYFLRFKKAFGKRKSVRRVPMLLEPA